MILYVLSFREDSLPKVHVKDISSVHLISYHPDRDLLPMILYFIFQRGQFTQGPCKGHILSPFDKLPPRQRSVTHDPLCFIFQRGQFTQGPCKGHILSPFDKLPPRQRYIT